MLRLCSFVLHLHHCDTTTETQQTGKTIMNANKMLAKFTTEQLKEALLGTQSAIGLRDRCDPDGFIAYQMTFDELHRRMGDVAFDAWCDTWY
jgi:hypothetical protein